MTGPSDTRTDEYIAVIDQDEVTDEVRDIAVKYDPLNRSGHEGFYVTDDGELHIADALVMEEHKLIEKKIPNDAIQIVPLPSETGQLVHQYGENGFRLYNLPAPQDGSVVGLLGRNGIGKSTALHILAGRLTPNFGDPAAVTDWRAAVQSFRGTSLQTHVERLGRGEITAAYKRQQVESTAVGSDETVRERLAETDDSLVSDLQLQSVMARKVVNLSGGERQRVAIAETLSADSDLYLFDEPSSFLDVGQRLTTARTIRDRVRDANAAAIVVEHDLATLDLLSDTVHITYGEPGGFGVVSQRLSTRNGINQFLEGRLKEDNVQIRRNSIEFPTASDRRVHRSNPVLEYPTLEKHFEDFSLTVESGRINEAETIGIVGANALGKTTFVKLLAGSIEAGGCDISEHATISYKPQHITPDSQGTVRERFGPIADIYSQSFTTQIGDPFDLEALYDRPLDDLSGGELQRVGVALCLARDADLYLLDEPSAYLDVDRRVSLADGIRRFTKRTKRPVFVVDHDVFLIDRVVDRLIVFEGTPSERGQATAPQPMRDGMNAFLGSLGVTFRRDTRTGRPRVNKPGSQLDREQKRRGEYYYDG